MACLLSLSAELKLAIIEQHDHPSNSFIPGPFPDLLNISKVCKIFRALASPHLFRDLVILNDKNSASSISTIIYSLYAEDVRTVHYIGVHPIATELSIGTEEPPSEPSSDDLPEVVEHGLSNLTTFPGLERLIVEFRYGKTHEEDEWMYRDSYMIGGEPEDDEWTIDNETTDAFRSMMKRSYDAIGRNPPGSVTDLELRNVIAKRTTAWDSAAFRELLKGLSTFTISLRRGDNGAGWRMNTVLFYLDFIDNLHNHFFEHMDKLKHLRISATEDGPPGLEGWWHNVALPIRPGSLTELESLRLDHVFISIDLAEWITTQAGSLKSARSNHCYSGLDTYDTAAREVAVWWCTFFTRIASVDVRYIMVFQIGPSDPEVREPSEHCFYGRDEAKRSNTLRESFPGRRMFDYKTVDDKYGMLFDSEQFDSEQGFGMFEAGEVHAAWERLCAALGKTAERF